MNQSMVRFSIPFLLIVMYSSQARSETRYVPADYTTIQAAIDVSIDGDIVEIAPGTYTESFDYLGKAITVRCAEPVSCFLDSTTGLQIGIRDVHSGTAVLENICFSRCTCHIGGIVVSNSNAALRNVICAYNFLEGFLGTGSVLIITDSTVTVSDCIFFGNVSSSNALLGGDVVNLARSDVTFQNCTIDFNRTDHTVSSTGSILTMDACTVSRNHSSDCGGGVSLTGSSFNLTGSIICDNRSGLYGGGIAMSDMSHVTIGGEEGRGNRFYGNAASAGEDIYYFSDQPVLWNAQYNEFSRIPNERTVLPVRNFDLRFCTFPGTGISRDVYVSPDGDDSADGLTPQTAFRSISHAVDVLTPQPGHPITVHLTPGTYSRSTTGEQAPIPLYDNIHIVGASSASTIIDAEGVMPVMSCNLARTCSLQNVTLTGGKGEKGGGFQCVNRSSPWIFQCAITGNQADIGGGLYIEDASPVFKACDVSGNTADAGGGMYISQSSPFLVDCRIQNNSTTQAGGAVYDWQSESMFYFCVISGNTSSRGGALRFYEGDSGYVIGCRIFDNSASQYGGGIACQYATPSILNTLITDNRTDGSGGGIDVQKGAPEIINTTVAGNSALAGGSGVSCSSDGNALIRNCIVFGNDSDGIGILDSEPVVTFSNTQDPNSGEGNISADPLFVEGPDDAYRLAHLATGDPADSPCIDSGGEAVTERTFELFGNTVSLSQFSTRSDSLPDTGVADMGYHGPAPGLEICPAVRIAMDTLFHPGDAFQIQCRIYNPGEPMVNVPVACAAEMDSIVYLWPGWTTELDYRVMDIPGGMMELSIIPMCTWPDTGDAEADDYRIIAGMLSDDLSGIRGLMDTVHWGYGP